MNRSTYKVLLLEGIHDIAKERFEKEGYEVISLKGALSEQELIDLIKDIDIIGIRSKTKISKKVLDKATHLSIIGCFCIGTDNVDLTAAEQKKIKVFNSPYCSSRSVAELIISEIVLLSRRIGDKNIDMHNGNWNKSAVNSYEIRNKILGIIGYGHVGSQVSILAEAMGMKVIFYDIESKLPFGNAIACQNLVELLQKANYITLHVPETPLTKNLITEKEINLMLPGSYLLNASRGSVVDLEALAKALTNGHLAGCAIDVFNNEPLVNCTNWYSILQKCPNTILTPHIGGSTLEAQYAIANDIVNKIFNYLETDF